MSESSSLVSASLASGPQPSGRQESMRRLEHELGVTIRRVRRAMAERAAMVHPGLSVGGYSVLTTLQREGPQRASAVAERFAIDKGAISRQVSHMERLGLVERRPDPADGRAALLHITALGRERLEQVAQERRVAWDENLSEWDDHELAEFARMLAAYNARLGG